MPSLPLASAAFVAEGWAGAWHTGCSMGLEMSKTEPQRTRRSAASARPIVLPKPTFTRGRSLLSALRLRRTTREISGEALPRQLLSQILWAACGINREEGPFGIRGRTAASASNSQEIDVYVALQRGTYLYEPAKHALLPVVSADLRQLAISRGQGGGAHAPVRFIYVADIDRLENTSGFQEPGLLDPDVQRSYYYVDTGLIAANVYLFAASCGLAAWFHNCEREVLSSKLKLRAQQRVLFAQTVGYAATHGLRGSPGT